MTKIQAVGVFILSQYGKEAGTIELNKLFYLADVAAYRLLGKTISGTKYVRAEHGPYSRSISQQLCLLEGTQIKREVKPSKGFSSYPKIAWSAIGEEKATSDLLEEEKEIIRQVLDKVKGLAPRDLEKLSYKTEPMLDVLGREKKGNCELLQESLDFKKVQRDEFMQEFLANLDSPKSKEEQEQATYYDEEWKTVELMLQGN